MRGRTQPGERKGRRSSFLSDSPDGPLSGLEWQRGLMYQRERVLWIVPRGARGEGGCDGAWPCNTLANRRLGNCQTARERGRKRSERVRRDSAKPRTASEKRDKGQGQH